LNVMTENPPSRRRPRSPSPQQYSLDADDDTYEPYVPVAQRRQAKLARFSSRIIDSESEREKKEREESEERYDAEKEEENRRERARRERTLLIEAEEVNTKKALEGVWSLLPVEVGTGQAD
jgi:ATP-dependent RNA helicase DDX41